MCRHCCRNAHRREARRRCKQEEDYLSICQNEPIHRSDLIDAFVVLPCRYGDYRRQRVGQRRGGRCQQEIVRRRTQCHADTPSTERAPSHIRHHRQLYHPQAQLPRPPPSSRRPMLHPLHERLAPALVRESRLEEEAAVDMMRQCDRRRGLRVSDLSCETSWSVTKSVLIPTYTYVHDVSRINPQTTTTMRDCP